MQIAKWKNTYPDIDLETELPDIASDPWMATAHAQLASQHVYPIMNDWTDAEKNYAMNSMKRKLKELGVKVEFQSSIRSRTITQEPFEMCKFIVQK